MIHVVSSSPLKSDCLERCLNEIKKDDILFLVGEAVLAFKDEKLYERLEDIDQLYSLTPDLFANNISLWCGKDVTYEYLLKLIKKHGSPLTWK
jgi:sulfur relay protein TusB/DsrH